MSTETLTLTVTLAGKLMSEPLNGLMVPLVKMPNVPEYEAASPSLALPVGSYKISIA